MDLVGEYAPSQYRVVRMRDRKGVGACDDLRLRMAAINMGSRQSRQRHTCISAEVTSDLRPRITRSVMLLKVSMHANRASARFTDVLRVNRSILRL